MTGLGRDQDECFPGKRPRGTVDRGAPVASEELIARRWRAGASFHGAGKPTVGDEHMTNRRPSRTMFVPSKVLREAE